VFIRSGGDVAKARKVLLAGLAFRFGCEAIIFYAEGIEEGFDGAADLPFGVDIDVIELIGLKIDAPDSGFYCACDRVHDHERGL